MALFVAYVCAGCSSAHAAPDDGQAGAGTIADLVQRSDEPALALTETSARESGGPGRSLEIAAYALQSGYAWREGWWWLDLGDGVLHAIFEEVNHYGIGVMIPTEAGDARHGRAMERMRHTVHDLEPDGRLASEAVAFLEGAGDRYAQRAEVEYSTKTTLYGREIEAVLWRSRNAQGLTVGFLLVLEKP